MKRAVLAVLVLWLVGERQALAAAPLDVFPPAEQIRSDHPRLLIRPETSPFAVSLPQLAALPRDEEFRAVEGQLRSQRDASAQAMVWLLTGDRTAADQAIARMRAYRFPKEFDTFHVYLRLTEFALAYDWLCRYDGFTPEIRAEIRALVAPLAEAGLKQANDHVFHNYIWMCAGGTSLWAMAIARDDTAADQLYARIAQRMNSGLLPAMQYLDGLPCEPMGYWALYDFTPAAMAVLAVQSAFERDVLEKIRSEQGNWLERHFENLIHSTLPDLRYIPWGDLQSGPNGGVTHSMAGTIDAMTWALRSHHGAYFSRWLRDKRGLARFYGDTAVFYPVYTRQLSTNAAAPQLSFCAGNHQSSHFIARSDWTDNGTIVALRSTDHFGDHNHYDQGSFTIYRQGLLAVDPPVYRQVRGPQQTTEHHNTLLINGQPQRPARGQWFGTLAEFQRNLNSGRQLETGDMPFTTDQGAWAAACAQFAQAYDPKLVSSCVRQLLFFRPTTIVVVDRLMQPTSGERPSVDWLIQFPREPQHDGSTTWSSNEKSWIRCRALQDDATLEIGATPVNTYRAKYSYPAAKAAWLVHVLEVGDGPSPTPPLDAHVRPAANSLELTLAGKKFQFSASPPYAVSEQGL